MEINREYKKTNRLLSISNKYHNRYMILLMAFVLSVCISACSNSSIKHACDSCKACESCVLDASGIAKCSPVKQSKKVCSGNTIVWADSCDNIGANILECTSGSQCSLLSEQTAECVCVEQCSGSEDSETDDTDSETDDTDFVDSATEIDSDSATEFATDSDAEIDTDSDTESIMPTGLVWVHIDGGVFSMGSERENIYDTDTGPSIYEVPVHNVTISAFEMTKTEVTVKQYEECVSDNSCTSPSCSSSSAKYFYWGQEGYSNYPVNCVDWFQASNFCNWIGGKLPSESQWEYAARNGGLDVKFPWGEIEATCEYVVKREPVSIDTGLGCGTGNTMEVCSKTAGNTTQGICDMNGNVSEWVEDVSHSNYDGAPTDGSAWEGSSSNRVSRGGNFYSYTGGFHSTYRYTYLSPDGHSITRGIRCTRDVH